MIRTWIRLAAAVVAFVVAPSIADAKMTVSFGPTKLNPKVRVLARSLLAPAEFAEEVLPAVRNVPIFFQDCGQVNALYSPAQRRITVCYELVLYLEQNAIKVFADPEEEPDVELVHAAYHQSMLYAFFHEVAHAYIHLSDHDVTGMDEDVADQLSTYLMWGLEIDHSSMLGGLVFFRLDDDTALDSWDEHSPDKRRLANLACWSFGANPEGAGELFTATGTALGDVDGMAHRKPRCAQEWAKIKKVWSKVVKLDGR